MREYIPPGKEFNAEGAWIPQGDPVELPIGLKRPPTMNERVKELVFRELSRQAQQEGLESLEEANNFDIDEPDGSQLPMSQYEMKDVREEVPVEQFIRQKRYKLKEVKNAEGRDKVEGDDDSGVAKRAGVVTRPPTGGAGRSDRRGKAEGSDSEHRTDAKSD